MYEAIFIAKTGLTNQQRRIDTTADNIANINTVGFKSARLDFKDALYTAGFPPAPAATPEPQGSQQKGHGVMTAAITRNFHTGSLIETESQLDVALIGDDGFLELRTPTGERLYSTGGSLYLSTNDDGTAHLVNSNGYFVQDTEGNDILVPEGTTWVSLAQDGELTFHLSGKLQEEVDPAEASSVRIGVYTFPNKQGLDGTGQSLFRTTVASGEKLAANGEIPIKQGFLESSNVNLAIEMTRLIRAQRAFSLASRALTTADDMEGIANSMRR